MGAMSISGTLRSMFRTWAKNSTGLGVLARQVRSTIYKHTRRKHRLGNIAMLHAGRCGSSVLADLLNQHPDVRWAGELFENMLPAYYRMHSGKRAYHVIANSMYERKDKHYGFDSKYLPEQQLRPELANKTPDEYVALLEKLGFNYFILLNRRNHLRRAVSVAIGSKTGQWNTFHAHDVKKTTARLDPERFISYGKEMTLKNYFRSLDETYATLKKRLNGNNLLELSYEDDIQKDPQIAYQKTCHFLDIEPEPVTVRLQKINPQPISRLVENFEEVALSLKGTEYEWMLGE